MRSRRWVAAVAWSIGQQIVRVAAERRSCGSSSRHGPRISASTAGRLGRSHRVDRARFRVIAGEEGGVHVDTAHHTRRAEPDDAPVVCGPSRAAGASPIRPSICRARCIAFAPHRRDGLEQILLRREELVVRGHDRGAEPFRGEIDEIEKGALIAAVRHTRVTSRLRSHTRSPRTNVVRTAPDSGRPAYGVSLCR